MGWGCGEGEGAAAVVDMRATTITDSRGEHNFCCKRLVRMYGMAMIMHVSMAKHHALPWAVLPSTYANPGSNAA